ncbi:unnamed protein product [Candida verbasci]|uniref:LicD/FKTN/FKRP nucleotidyltransferase domain-containing protein n=1 Tax=Candida verbasci TaxID=1227364 RepID=A0A9W4TS15_9ASCO|nr:unnamed protein product [Candida verbasci]
MILRRTRCLLLILIICIIHIIILSLINLNSSFKNYIIDNLTSINISNLRNLIKLNKFKNNVNFDLKLVNSLDEKYTKQLPTNPNFSEIDIPSTESISEYQPFDPRFTLGLLLKYINENNNQNGDLVVPNFHWADYTDMSLLEDQLFKVDKLNCDVFNVRRKSPERNRLDDLKDPVNYCINDYEIEKALTNDNFKDEFKQNLLKLKDNNLSTGFHIHSWTGRAKSQYRPLIAKSYLNDFMTLPKTITLLIPSDKMLQLNVNQDVKTSKVKIKDSVMFKPTTVNIKDELSKLSLKLGSTEFSLKYERHLKYNDFVDQSEDLVTELNQKELLNITDLNYLQSLKSSLINDNPPKYFHEANIIKKEKNYGIGAHYDWRFINGIINYTPKQPLAIHALIKAWLKLTNLHNLNTWVAHGSLLSWYWNGLQFPWDGDIDVQMPISDLHKLSRSFNQSLIIDYGTNSDLKFGRFFLDCSTFISHRSRGNGNNNIDARFIDVDTGLYIDITGLAVSETKAPTRYNNLLKNTNLDRNSKDATITQYQRNSYMQIFNCRNNHFLKFDEISPLRLSLIEGEYTYIPSEFELAILYEYGDKSLKDTSFKNYIYLPKLRLWIKKNSIIKYMKEVKKLPDAKNNIAIDLTDDEYIDFLKLEEDNLIEYLKVSNLTQLHQEEMFNYFDGKSTREMFEKDYRVSLREDYFKFTKFDGEYNYNIELGRIKSKIVEYEKELKNKQEMMRNDKQEMMKNDPVDQSKYQY